MDDTVYLRDIDGTGSMHVCVKGDAGAVEYVPAATLTAQAAEIARLKEALLFIATGGFKGDKCRQIARETLAARIEAAVLAGCIGAVGVVYRFRLTTSTTS